MSKSTTISLPNTTPGGMDAHVHSVPVPGVDDRVVIGPIIMPMAEFCALVEHVLTSAPIKAEDPRTALVERLQQNLIHTGEGKGRRMVVLDKPATEVT